jgi:molybdopterin synthase sulfur carrier subunit
LGDPEGAIATLGLALADSEEVTVAVLRLFAGAREAAGTSRDELPGRTVGDVLDAARERYGPAFTELLDHCAIWCNGEPCELDLAITDTDELAVLPPVSGGGA